MKYWLEERLYEAKVYGILVLCFVLPVACLYAGMLWLVS